ncbi:uncharacterized protein LOC114880564 [Osmia bicornis bicornis]|uniref:uncharacterized protein LOC114880564 n=1 Tax=Osmia bicornis bicornis TaxID=1437191 RepID=UPI0010FA5492|nr:uncharacterized protein LOC114880564 [Osmia bicornis bicornis]
MKKIIQKLLIDSIKLRNLSTLSNYSTLQNYVNSSQDTLECKGLEKHKEDIKKLNPLSLDDGLKTIIKNIQKNDKNMDVKEAIKVLDILKNTFNNDKELSCINIKDSEEFVHVCKVIHKNVRSLHMYDMIRILRILLFFNVSPKSVLIQTLLQLISASLNNLSIREIIILYNTLNRLEKLPLIKSLLIALPHVFKQRALLELDEESNNLFKALKFSFAINDLKTKLYIINILHKSKKNIALEDIVDIFYALYTLPEMNSASMNLLFKIKYKIRINCQSFTFNEIQLLLNYISTKVANEEMKFYCEEMVDGLCNAVIKHDVTFHQNILILRCLNKMRHSNISLLDHLATKLVESRNFLKQCTIFDIDHFIKSLIIADYKPSSWEIIQTMLLDFVTNVDYTAQNSVSVAFRLLSLNCYCPELVEKAFTLCQPHLMTLRNEQIILTILKLHWCVKLLCPEYNGVTLNENVLDQININYKRDEVPSLLENLKEALGGADCIMSGLTTKFGEFIDCVVVIQPNGFPMDVSNYNVNIRFVEELESLSECYKILFLAFPEKAYSFNKQNMLSTVKMELKAIETLKGFYTIVINPYLWKVLPNNEKVSYLQQTIKSKCNISGIPKYY